MNEIVPVILSGGVGSELCCCREKPAETPPSAWHKVYSQLHWGVLNVVSLPNQWL